MANTDFPNGLRAVRQYAGGGTIPMNEYKIASGLAANIGHGSPVKSTGTTKRVTIAAAGDTLRGVACGVRYVATDGTPTFRKDWVSGTVTLASAEATVMVWDDPMTLFETQASAGFAVTDIGASADLTTESVNAATGMSTAEVDSATFTTVTSQVLVIDYVQMDDNTVTANAKLLVLINEHELKAARPGV